MIACILSNLVLIFCLFLFSFMFKVYTFFYVSLCIIPRAKSSDLTDTFRQRRVWCRELFVQLKELGGLVWASSLVTETKAAYGMNGVILAQASWYGSPRSGCLS